MKAVILAGGYGTRLSEETNLKPKPMVEIGGYPVLWHIMKIYSHYGINDFVICLGYKGYVIKEFFANYRLHMSDLEINLKNNEVRFFKEGAENWNVTLIDTGTDTMTGGRLKRVMPCLNEKEDFCFTYGDGLSDVNIGDLIQYHKEHDLDATVTAVQTPGRFGVMNIDNGQVQNFEEKPERVGFWVNGGFFVLNPRVCDYLKDDTTVWEREPLETLAREGRLAAFEHQGCWEAMDTLRDKIRLEELWQKGAAPWKVWCD